jgi:hypothetical protein
MNLLKNTSESSDQSNREQGLEIRDWGLEIGD